MPDPPPSASFYRGLISLTNHLGLRTEGDTIAFTEKLTHATRGNFQITTDGFKPYQHAIVLSLGAQHVDFAQLVTLYTSDREGEQRYSPAECTGAKKVPIYGNPDMTRVSTSHIERQNLTVRMSMRRMTRLTNAFSKKWMNLKYSYALHFAYYNFCKVHSSLRTSNGSWNHKPYLDAERTSRGLNFDWLSRSLSRSWSLSPDESFPSPRVSDESLA